MKDFYLTPRGDLSIENVTNAHKRLELNFITSYSNALCLNFFIEDTYQSQTLPNALYINFDIYKPEYNKELRMISGNQALEQAVKIRLSSALGSLRGNKDIGSKIETVMHSFTDAKNTQIDLIAYIQEAIADIIPNAEIELSVPKTKYVDYSNSINIVIKDKDKKINISL
ncbi:hypothetical protein [Paraclostridium dentum]|uniref:hypothetical protein n=1 Tax=Paraclostridium dentum TaxID=2662455 RepID=UPI003F2B240F